MANCSPPSLTFSCTTGRAAMWRAGRKRIRCCSAATRAITARIANRWSSLIVNAEGFPLSYETFDGNRADVTTLEVVMRMVERKYGRARRVWVFDRGIVSEANLASLRKRGAQYLVGTPRSKLKAVERELLEDGWVQVREEVEAKWVPMPDSGTETYVLCRSTARREKERAIRCRFSSRMERALKKLEQQVEKGRLQDRQKIERRWGKIQARHPQVA